MKILVCDPVSPKGIALLQQRPEFDVVVLPKRLSEAELLPVVKDVVAMVVRSETKVTRNVIEAAKSLRVVGRAGVGVDNVDVDAATQRGVVVMNTPGGNTVSTAELSFAMILSLARKVPQAYASMAAGKWDRKQFQGSELSGKTLGVLGLGRIGSEVAKRALAFGMRVIAYDPFLTEARAKALGIALAADLDAVYRDADFITVHMPVTEQTRGMLNAAAFSKMKPKVCIVNCARGEIVVENDLLAALDSGKVAAAALDVFAAEPLPADTSLPQASRHHPHPAPRRQHPRSPGKMRHRSRRSHRRLPAHRRSPQRGQPALPRRQDLRAGPPLPRARAKNWASCWPSSTPAPGGPPPHHLRRQSPGTAQHRPRHPRHPPRLPLAAPPSKTSTTSTSAASPPPSALRVEEKRSNEPVTFNEWLHVQAFRNGDKVVSAGGTFFGSPDNPRIVRVFSQPTEIVPSGIVLLLQE